MRTTLIILNQQRYIPAFMLTALYCAKERFSEVYYVNTDYPTNAKLFEGFNQIVFCAPTKKESVLGLVKAFCGLFKKEVRKDFSRCIKEKGLGLDTVRHFYIEQYVHARLFSTARHILAKGYGQNCTILSTWLSACSYTAAVLKRAYPSVRASSLAHSYEVLASRNPFLSYQHIIFKHRYLDSVFFISKTIREMYLEGVGGLPYPLLEKTRVCYLGSCKENPEQWNQPEESVFNVCSCSSVIPLKRVSMLLDSLRDWSLCPLRWTHIGNGPLFEELRNKASELVKENPNVEIRLLGRIPNNEVKQYYANNPVDIFVNLSEIEGLPVSIMEAISFGIPVLATDVGGTKEIVTPDVGFLLDPNISAREVKERLMSYYYLQKEQKDALRKSAYLFWKHHFDASNNMKELFNQL